MTTVAKQSVTIRGHRTSISLEREFLDDLTALALARHISLAALIAEIDTARPRDSNLSSAIRLHVLAHWKEAVRRISQ